MFDYYGAILVVDALEDVSVDSAVPADEFLLGVVRGYLSSKRLAGESVDEVLYEIGEMGEGEALEVMANARRFWESDATRPIAERLLESELIDEAPPTRA